MPRITKTIEIEAYSNIEIEKYTGDQGLTLTLTDPDDTEIVLDFDEVQRLIDGLAEVRDATELLGPEIQPTPVNSVAVAESQVTAFIQAKVPILIDYVREDGEQVRRTVSPYEIKRIKDGARPVSPKFLVGFEQDNNGIRNYRLARIRGIAPAAADYRPQGG